MYTRLQDASYYTQNGNSGWQIHVERIIIISV